MSNKKEFKPVGYDKSVWKGSGSRDIWDDAQCYLFDNNLSVPVPPESDWTEKSIELLITFDFSTKEGYRCSFYQERIKRTTPPKPSWLPKVEEWVWWIEDMIKPWKVSGIVEGCVMVEHYEFPINIKRLKPFTGPEQIGKTWEEL